MTQACGIVTDQLPLLVLAPDLEYFSSGSRTRNKGEGHSNSFENDHSEGLQEVKRIAGRKKCDRTGGG